MDVSVIIVNYNTRKLTGECIDSIFEKTSGITFEVIVVDNASQDDSIEIFRKDPRIIFIEITENQGFGKANNLGIKYATGRNILFLISDNHLPVFFNIPKIPVLYINITAFRPPFLSSEIFEKPLLKFF